MTAMSSVRLRAVESGEPVLLRHDAAGVATLTLNRPNAYNALSEQLLGELERSLEAIAGDVSVRVVVVAGAGPAFCAGHDLKEMRADYDEARIAALFEQCSRVMLAITRLPQPVIARVHGIATAAGCQLVAQCDLAVAAETARFAVSGINVGLFCSTPAVPLARNMPRKQAMEMLLTGDFIDAATALSRGLVNRVVPLARLDDEVAALTQAIKSKPPHALALGKRLFYEQVDADLGRAYAMASEAMTCNFMHGEAAEGVDAFLQKRPPNWSS